MKKIVWLLLLLKCQISNGQNLEQKDSLISVICRNIIALNGTSSDSLIVQTVYQNHLYPFLEKFPENTRKEIGTSVYYRLQRNCREFSLILDRLEEPKGDWEKVNEKPKTNLLKKECRGFLEHIKYSYLEYNGDTVKLQIENGVWIDHFKDGTYSKLKFKWLEDCEFEISFVESNNESRKNFSKPGDKYVYQILDKKDKYYLMSAWIPGMSNYLKFKIYF